MPRAAIVGLGRWGRNLVRSQQGTGARLAFVRAVDAAPDAPPDYAGPGAPETGRVFAARHGMPVDTDLAAVLADPAIEAVVLATPHSLHRAQVEACAAAGKPVFCEKPLALTLADARAMVEACERAGVPFGLGHNRRWWPSMRALRAAVAAGEIGELLHVEGHFSNEHSNHVRGGWRSAPEESPGGGLTGAGLHLIDAFVSIAGPVAGVQAQLVVRKPAPAPLDVASALYRFANGTSGMLASVRATPFFFRVHAFGSLGSVEARGEHELVRYASEREPRRETLAPVDSLALELAAFADALEGRAPYPIDRVQMLATTAAFEATVRAMETGAETPVAAL